MTFRLPTLKPRNPLVAASLQRRAGSHRRSTTAGRQSAQRALHSELRQLDLRQHRSP
ncbi:hypothetical protein [Ideonella paludis]|uniref:Uncharacterized protein n=1 Tax=Ideonella paludis TaxID=1233411 RepID=A0ABS5DZS4_9BURK|nr:hypothetical protein [Ideonella paludis]MBQ0936663.1 hypothetical protein [Ideonella paludis]